MGDVFVHYGGTHSSGCMMNAGPVNLDRQVCFIMCTCGFNLDVCVSITTQTFTPGEMDGIEKDAKPDAALKAKIIGTPIEGNFRYKGDRRPLRLMRIKVPSGEFGLAYELSDPQAMDYPAPIVQQKSRLGELKHDGMVYHVLLRRDLDP
jgi:hypothetical protein